MSLKYSRVRRTIAKMLRYDDLGAPRKMSDYRVAQLF
jgi:hypothetical protein